MTNDFQIHSLIFGYESVVFQNEKFHPNISIKHNLKTSLANKFITDMHIISSDNEFNKINNKQFYLLRNEMIRHSKVLIPEDVCDRKCPLKSYSAQWNSIS